MVSLWDCPQEPGVGLKLRIGGGKFCKNEL